MKLAALTTFLSLVSVTSCSTTTGENKENTAANNAASSNTVLTTPTKPHTYTNQLQRREGKENIRSRLVLDENDVTALQGVNFHDPANHSHGIAISSVSVHDPRGVDLDNVKNIARNLDPEFVKAAVHMEQQSRQQGKQNDQK